MSGDVRETPEYAAVAEHLRRLHEPAFGRPHAIADPHVAADGARVVVTGSVFDEVVGMPRTAIYLIENGEFSPVTAGAGSARWARLSPDGQTLVFLSDRTTAGVFQLFLSSRGHLSEVAVTPLVPGTVEYVH